MGITGQSRPRPWDLLPLLSWCHGVADPWGVLWYLRNALCHYRGYPKAQRGLTLPRSQSVQLDWSPRSAPGLALHQRLQALRAARQSQGRMGTPTLTVSLLCTERLFCWTKAFPCRVSGSSCVGWRREEEEWVLWGL